MTMQQIAQAIRESTSDEVIHHIKDIPDEELVQMALTNLVENFPSEIIARFPRRIKRLPPKRYRVVGKYTEGVFIGDLTFCSEFMNKEKAIELRRQRNKSRGRNEKFFITSRMVYNV